MIRLVWESVWDFFTMGLTFHFWSKIIFYITRTKYFYSPKTTIYNKIIFKLQQFVHIFTIEMINYKIFSIWTARWFDMSGCYRHFTSWQCIKRCGQRYLHYRKFPELEASLNFRFLNRNTFVHFSLCWPHFYSPCND